MEALTRRIDARYELYAATPRWFFDESVEGLYRLHELRTDVGFVQHSALAYDARGTARALGELLPFDEGLVEGLAMEVRRSRSRAVLCDISPLGVAVAERAGVPSVLVENFTWPWLYEPLFAEVPELTPLSAQLTEWFARATVHIQAEPVCVRDPSAALVVPPVSRAPRRARAEMRKVLDIEADEPAVILTMGGVPEAMPFLDRLRDMGHVTFLVTGAAETRRDGNLRLFDNRTRVYMPDLIRAADAVVAKLGYSTVSEIWHEGTPLAFVTRADFRETEPLVQWVSRELEGFEIPGADFDSGGWVERVPELLGMPRRDPQEDGGAERVAAFVAEDVLGIRG